jgi:hypothetical protein
LLASALLFAAGAHEGTYGEVGEDGGNDHIEEKPGVVGAGLPGVAEFVCVLGEEEAKDGEEEAGDFEPEDPAGVGEGSPDGLAELFAFAFDRAAAFGIDGSLLLHGISSLHSSFAQHPGGHADADPDFSAQAVRFHTSKV